MVLGLWLHIGNNSVITIAASPARNRNRHRLTHKHLPAAGARQTVKGRTALVCARHEEDRERDACQHDGRCNEQLTEAASRRRKSEDEGHDRGPGQKSPKNLHGGTSPLRQQDKPEPPWTQQNLSD